MTIRFEIILLNVIYGENMYHDLVFIDHQQKIFEHYGWSLEEFIPNEDFFEHRHATFMAIEGEVARRIEEGAVKDKQNVIINNIRARAHNALSLYLKINRSKFQEINLRCSLPLGLCASLPLLYGYLKIIHPNVSLTFLNDLSLEDFILIVRGFNYYLEGFHSPEFVDLITSNKELIKNYYTRSYLINLGVMGRYQDIRELYFGSNDTKILILTNIMSRTIEIKRRHLQNFIMEALVPGFNLSPEDYINYLYQNLSFLSFEGGVIYSGRNPSSSPCDDVIINTQSIMDMVIGMI